MMYCMERIGEQIRKVRKKQGISRKKLADKLKCTAEAVRLWENGKRRPSQTHIFALYRILNIPLGGLHESLENLYINESKSAVINKNLIEKVTLNQERTDMIYMAEQLIKTSRKLTVYTERNQIYLNKNFFEVFEHEAEICVHPKNCQKLLIREKTEGIPKKSYFSAAVVRHISRTVQAEGNLFFVCLWDEQENS